MGYVVIADEVAQRVLEGGEDEVAGLGIELTDPAIPADARRCQMRGKGPTRPVGAPGPAGRLDRDPGGRRMPRCFWFPRLPEKSAETKRGVAEAAERIAERRFFVSFRPRSGCREVP